MNYTNLCFKVSRISIDYFHIQSLNQSTRIYCKRIDVMYFFVVMGVKSTTYTWESEYNINIKKSFVF